MYMFVRTHLKKINTTQMAYPHRHCLEFSLVRVKHHLDYFRHIHDFRLTKFISSKYSCESSFIYVIPYISILVKN